MLLRLGYRNLWRNKRRTALTMGAMTAATFLVILTLGLNEGVLWDMIEGATELQYGHVNLSAPGYRSERRTVLTLPEHATAMDLRGQPGVLGVAGRIRGFALLSFGGDGAAESQPAELLGIDPDEEPTVTVLHERIVIGSFIENSAGDEIVLGVGLARRLGAGLGGEIPTMGQAADGSIAQGMFRVVGILDTGDPMRDNMLALVGRKAAQEFLVLPEQVHEWAVRLERPLGAIDWAKAQQQRFEGIEILPWQQMIPVIAQYLEMWSQMQVILALIYYFAVILVAANTMSMSFFERIREFAVMGAIGLNPKRLSRLIVLEGLMLSAGSATIGGAFGAMASFYFFHNHIDLSGWMESIRFGGTVMLPRLRCYPTVQNIGMPIGLILCLGVLVSLFPAFRLRRLRPVKALAEV